MYPIICLAKFSGGSVEQWASQHASSHSLGEPVLARWEPVLTLWEPVLILWEPVLTLWEPVGIHPKMAGAAREPNLALNELQLLLCESILVFEESAMAGAAGHLIHSTPLTLHLESSVIRLANRQI
jgi:hypothetical protein